MRRVIKLGLLALTTAVAACGFAPAASASFTCTGRRLSCVITLTARVDDPSRSGSTDYRSFFTRSFSISCVRSTMSSDGRGADSFASGNSNITFTALAVDFIRCTVIADLACTVSMTPTTGDSSWTIRLVSSPRGATSYDVAYSSGEIRILTRTCGVRGNDGTITIGRQSFGPFCSRYTPFTGIVAVNGCAETFRSTIFNVPAGIATLTVSYHATVDGTIGLSPTVSNDP